MTRPGLKEAILDAAESIVIESGALRKTLDAVAERANVSKGGLIYNFPNKEALLEAMIKRLMERHDQLREQVRQGLAPEASPLLVELKLFMELSETDFQLSSALLAANANQPELLNGVRERLRERLLKEIAPPEHFEQSAILYFAALGLHFHELLGISLLSQEQKKNVIKEMMRLVEGKGW